MFYTCLCQTPQINIVLFQLLIRERAIVSILWHRRRLIQSWRDNMRGKRLETDVKWWVIPHRLMEHVKAVKATYAPSGTCKIGNVTERIPSWRYEHSGWRARLLKCRSKDRWPLLQITVQRIPKRWGKTWLKGAVKLETVFFFIPRDNLILWSGDWPLHKTRACVWLCLHHIHSLFCSVLVLLLTSGVILYLSQRL